MPQRQRELDPDASPLAMFGAELRMRRLDRGLSQARLGRMVHVSGDLLAKIEKAERRPSIDLVVELDDALSAGGLLSELFVPVEQGERAFPRLPSSHLPLGNVTAPHLRTVITQTRRADHRHHVGDQVKNLAGHTQAAEARLGTTGSTERRDLAGAVAEAHQLLGWISFDHGNINGAKRAFRAARRHADHAGDAQLIAFVAGPNHGFVTTCAGHPALGLELCYGALGWARRTGNHRLTAFVMAIAARAHARLGDTALCLHMLDDAESELELHRANEADPDWLTVFDRAGLAGHRGSCLLDLGQPGRAVEPLTEQDSAARELFVRNRVLWLLDRAKAWLHLTDAEAACDSINQALDLVGERPSPRVRGRFHAIVMALHPMAGTPEIDGLTDRIRHHTRSVGPGHNPPTFPSIHRGDRVNG